MKKTLIIIILGLSVLSVFVLGIFVPKIEQTIITIKVESVEFDHSDEIEIENTDGSTSKIVRLTENNVYQLKWKVYPYDEEKGQSNATTPDVTFASSNDQVTVSDDGLVTFPSDAKKTITTTITVRTADGDKVDTITISLYKEQSGVIIF